MVNLTKVRVKLNNVKKKLYYDADIPTLKILNINEVLLELSDGWFMPTTVTSNLAIGAEYWDLSIADVPDDIDLKEYLNLATQIEVDGERYRITQYTRPRGATQEWKLRLQATGERKSES